MSSIFTNTADYPGPVAPLYLDYNLEASARNHSIDMVRRIKNYFKMELDDRKKNQKNKNNQKKLAWTKNKNKQNDRWK